ncbi:MAG: hypothetical protein MUF54_04185 [Polyangiaceae bacterium]|jgi:ribonuclease HII|nr:hypothetical protein [Polyangiaceae bacterium]
MPIRVGIDENGLGPRLGPLIVTGIVADTTQEAERALTNNASVFLHERLADSKRLVDHRHIGLGEAWARVICEYVTGEAPTSPEALVTWLSLDDARVLRRPCPRHVSDQCWAAHGEAFDATDEQMAQARLDLDRLRDAGMRVRSASCMIACARRINEERSNGNGRMAIDLLAMERILAETHRRAGCSILATCGKVGGLQRYPSRFRVLTDQLVSVVREERAESAYRLVPLGEVRWLRDAEQQDPLVALASLVGKCVREVLMRRIVRYYKRHDPSLPDASGYNDPVTDRFVEATQGARRERRIPDPCFVREQGSRQR